jgi:hypothetical protein
MIRANSSNVLTTIYIIITATLAYIFMFFISSAVYAGKFDTYSIFGKTKNVIAISQNIGYIFGNIIGYFIVPKLNKDTRLKNFISTYFFAALPMLLFGTRIPVIQIIAMFLSGIFTIWIWGHIIYYIEGRHATGIIILIVYAGIIVGSGVAKSVGTIFLNNGISEDWMPAICSLIGIIGCTLFGYLLSKSPSPTEDEIIKNSLREPATSEEQINFIKTHKIGLISVCLVYGCLSSYRKFRDYYSLELWSELLGDNFDPSVYSTAELLIGISVIIVYFSVVFIHNDKKAFGYLLFVMLIGGFFIQISTIIYSVNYYSPYVWMILIGIGLYLTYIPPGAMLYDKLMAATGTNFTILSIIYISEATSQIIILLSILIKSLVFDNIGYVPYFIMLSYIIASIVIIGMIVAMISFKYSLKETTILPG